MRYDLCVTTYADINKADLTMIPRIIFAQESSLQVLQTIFGFLVIGGVLFACFYLKRRMYASLLKRREEYEQTHSAAEVQRVRWRGRFILQGITVCLLIYALVTGNWNVFLEQTH